MPIRVIFVDSDTMVRESFCRVLDREPGIQIVAETGLGRDAIEKAVCIEHDVIVIGTKLPDVDASEVARLILETNPGSAILGLTSNCSSTIIRLMVGFGVRGFLPKSDKLNDLAAAIRTLAAGGYYFEGKEIKEALCGRPDRSHTSKLARLTPREREIFDLKVAGWRNFSIARRLRIGASTVSCHFASVLKKLECADFAELIKFAIKSDLIL